MKELVLVISPSLSASRRLITDENFEKMFKYISQKISFKILQLNDEKTRQLFLKSNRKKVPVLFVDTGEEEIIELVNNTRIINFLNDIVKNIKAHVSSTNKLVSNSATQLYNNIFFVDCDRFDEVDFEMFDLIIISENCEITIDHENIITTNPINAVSLIKIKPLLDSEKRILVVSKGKRLAYIVIAMFMYFIEEKSLDDIEESLSIGIHKKPLKEIFKEDLKDNF